MLSFEDRPVVTMSSTRRQFEFGFILKPLLNSNLPFTRSKKIDGTFRYLAISCPIIKPPMAGETTKSILILIVSRIFLQREVDNLWALKGSERANAHCKYFEECKPEDKIK